MKELTNEQKKQIRSWIKDRKEASYVWISKEGAVNYTTAQGSFFAGWGNDIAHDIEREGN